MSWFVRFPLSASVFLACTSFLAVGSASGGTTVLRVNPQAPEALAGAGRDGKTWGTAYASIENALAAAQPSAVQPVEIWVAGGIYYPPATGYLLKSHLRLAGGFRGTETADSQRDTTHPTILSGDIGTPMIGAVTPINRNPPAAAVVGDPGWTDNVSNVLVGHRLTDVVLNGLTVTGGSATAAASKVPQTDVDGMEIFLDKEGDVGALASTVVPVSPLVAGGGLFFTAPERTDFSAPADLTIVQCVFTRNHARGYGGAVALRDAVVNLLAASFDSNVSDLNGGAISGLNSTLYANTCFFGNNIGTSQAGAIDLKGYPTIASISQSTGTVVGASSGTTFGVGGPGSDRDKLRVGISTTISAYNLANKVITKAITPSIPSTGGIGAKIKSALPNPFKDGLSTGARLNSVYELFKLAVTIGDQGVNLALLFGVSKDDPHVKDWQSFSYNFNTYATPAGLLSVGLEQLVPLINRALIAAGLPTEIQTLPPTRVQYKRLESIYYNTAGYSYFFDCRFTGNTTLGEGGAILDMYSNVHVENCSFYNNFAAASGGAISGKGFTVPKIINSIFQANLSEDGQSAIANADHSAAQVVNCTFYQNVSKNADGYALSAERGSSVRVANSVFWGNVNAEPANAVGGADVFAGTAASFDPDTKKTFDAAGGAQVDYVGTMQLKNCNLQSLARIPIGSAFLLIDILPDDYTSVGGRALEKYVADYHRLDDNGDTELAGLYYSGEGIRWDLRDAAQGNFSATPVFEPGTVVPAAGSPLIDRGSDARLLNSLYLHVRTSTDARANPRRVGGSVDVGAVEAQSNPNVPVEAAQPGNPDWTLRHVYVKPNPTGDGSGRDWNNATNKLAAAMNSLGAEVWVAAGTYKPATANRDVAFVLANGTRVYGGFLGTETTRDQRNWRANPTIFSGDLGAESNLDDSKHLVTCADVGSSTVLDGIYFEGTYSADDTGTGDYAGGGAVAALRSSPTITNCVFRQNWSRKGAAVWSYQAVGRGPSITGCEFYENRAEETGGALFYDSALWVADSRFFGNSAPGGGAITVTDRAGYAIVQQCILWKNSATLGFGGAILAGSGTLSINGSTIFANTCLARTPGIAGGGGGVYYVTPDPATARVSVDNSILLNNHGNNIGGTGRETIETEQLAVATTERVYVNHSLVQGINLYAGAASAGNFDADPQFVAPSNTINADFRFKLNSPAINAGDANASYTPTKDLAGRDRVMDGAIDIGPYECDTVVPTRSTLTATRDSSSGKVVNTFKVTTAPGSSGFHWQVDRGDGVWANLSADDVFSGVNTATLSITGASYLLNGWRFRLAYDALGYNGLTYYSAINQLKVGPPRIYVRAAATGANDGSSWANACASLRDALDLAEAGSEVWVAAGTYYPTKGSAPDDYKASLKLHSDVAIYGGFGGGETDLSQRRPRTNVTTLSGKLSVLTGRATDRNSQTFFFNDGKILSGACDRTAILDGFTLSDVTQYGIYNDKASPTVRNCIFTHNLGPSIFNWNKSNAFIGNSEFRANTAGQGAAIYSTDSDIAVENCLVADNVSTYTGLLAGAVQIGGGGSATVTHCTFANNTTPVSGAALAIGQSATIALRNSVVWGNSAGDKRTAPGTVALAGYNKLTLLNCCLQGASSTTGGNFTLEPLFLDPAQGNYQTARISPLRNAASPAYPTVSSEDVLGNGRGADAPDIGAYEATDGAITGVKVISLPAPVVKVKTTGGGTASFAVTIPTGGDFRFTWQVNLNDGNGWRNVSEGGRYALASDGSVFTLTISGVSAADNGTQVRIINTTYEYISSASRLTVIQPTVLYVNGAATGGAKNGQSWANAYTDLAAALKAATEKNEVWVARGIYTPPADSAFAPGQNVEIYGGFAGGETSRLTRNWQANETILHAAEGQSAVYCELSTTGPYEDYSVLDGFVLENASAKGAVYIHQRGEFFQNCVFRGNAVSVVNRYANPTFSNCVFTGGTGSAVKSEFAGATFLGCRFQDHVTDDYVVTGNSTPAVRFTDCVFSNNNAGGCVADYGPSATLTRCQFLGNVGRYTGAIFVPGSTFTIEDSLFAGNSCSSAGGAIKNRDGKLTIRGCTFADNSANSLGGAIWNEGDASGTVILNSVFWGNRAYVNVGDAPALEIQQIASASGRPAVTYSIVEGLSALAGTGNQQYAPLFVDSFAGNYRLNASSPAVNAGQRTAQSAATKDLDGLPRYVGNGQDIGAYELQGAKANTVQLTQAAASVSAPVLTRVAFTFAGPFNFHWQVFDPATQQWVNVDPSSPYYQVVVNGSSSSLVITSASLALTGMQFRVRELPNLPVTLTVRPPRIFYVDGGIGASGNGRTWEGAFKTVQEAVTASVAISRTNSAEIWVKAGTYPVGIASSPLKMSWPIQLYGGFAGTESVRDQRNWVQNVTTFTSAGNGVMIEDSGSYSRGYGGPTLDGFTVSGATQNGYSASWTSPVVRNCIFDGANSGVLIGRSANATFQNCTFRNLTNAPLRANGDSLVLDRCTFQDNANSLGTVLVSSGSSTITGSRFTGNSGGPVLTFYGNDAATATISRSLFTGNTTLYSLVSGYPSINLNIDNSLFADNQTTNGGVVECSGKIVNITYCTIANNRHQRAALGVRDASQTSVKFSILWGNRNTLPLANQPSYGVIDLKTAQACLLPVLANGASLSIYRGILEGEYTYANENYGFDPLFANPGAGDYRLAANSPAIGRGIAGVFDPADAVDLAGNLRRYPLPSGNPDAGAYEFQSPASASLQIYGDYGSKRVIVGTSAVFSFNGPADPVQWQVDKGTGFVNLSAGNGVAIQSNNPYVLTLSNVTLAMSGYKYRFVISGGHPYTSPASTLTVVAKPIRYVNPLAGGTGDGTSWTNAYTNLATALSDIEINNHNGNPEVTADIWVARGTYSIGSSYATLSRGVEIYGGFAGGEAVRSARDPKINVTTIVGQDGIFRYDDKSASIFGDVVIDGLTLTGAGTGLYNNSGNLAVRNCRFDGLTSLNLCNDGGALLVEDSTFTGGTNAYLLGTTTGAATAGKVGTVVMRRCRFVNGTNASLRSAVGTLTVEDSVFQNNTCGDGSSPCVEATDDRSVTNVVRCQFLNNGSDAAGSGAVSNQGGVMTIRQSLFTGNRGNFAGAIRGRGTLGLFGVTAAGNTVSSTDNGGAVYLEYSGKLTVANSILWGNRATRTYGTAVLSQIKASNPADATVRNTALENAYLVSGAGSLPSSYDPRFVGNGDYHLQGSSPYIGQGNASSPNVLNGETDLAGNSRLTGGKTDYGAYQNGVSTGAIAIATLPPGAVTQASGGDIVLAISGAAGNTYAWQYSDDGGLTWKSISDLPAYILRNIATQNGTSTLTFPGVPLSLSGYQFRVAVNGQSFTSSPVAVTVTVPEGIYVDASAPAGGNGKTWASAYRSLDTAIAAVTVARRIIYVAEGTYVPADTFSITKRMEIYGGYPAGGDTVGAPRDPAAHPTALSGLVPDSTSRKSAVLTIQGGYDGVDPVPRIQPDTILDGLTIQDGQTGINASYANPTIRNVLVQGNTAGGLVAIQYLGGSIEDCRFLGNTSSYGAGAYLGKNSSVTISRSVFQGNVASYRGGGLAISSSGGRIRLTNVLVTGNVAVEQGGGIVTSFSSPTIENSVLAGNRTGAAGGGGVYAEVGTPTLQNSILWGNRSTTGTIEDQQLAAGPQASYRVYSSDIESVSRYASGATGVDPVFLVETNAVDAPTLSGDYRLSAASALLNAGADQYVTSPLDLAGFPRRYGTVDLGAYEYQGDPASALAFIRQPSDFVFSRLENAVNEFRVELAAPSGLSYQWEFSKGNAPFTSTLGDARFGGAATATLTVLTGDYTLDGALFRCRVTSAAGVVARSQSARLTVYPAHYCVDSRAANDTGDGLTWATAMKTLPRALNTARIDPATGVEIWVATGTYVTPSVDGVGASFRLRNKVSLYGGFAGNETALDGRDPALNPTVLNGLTGTRAVISDDLGGFGGESALVDGFSIGQAATGIDMITGMAIQVSRCTFTGLDTGIFKTLALYGTARQATVRDCRFVGLKNIGIASYNGPLAVSDSVFIGNGRGVSFDRGFLQIQRGEFRGNQAGGLYVGVSGDTLVENSLFSGNRNTVGGGIQFDGGSLTVRSCTIAGNYATSFAGGLYFNGGRNLTVTNSILWGNDSPVTYDLELDQVDPGRIAVDTSDNTVQNADLQYGAFRAARGNVSIEPAFAQAVAAGPVPATGGDYRITSLSKLVNRGSNSHPTSSATDLTGSPRVFGAAIDLGAYEFQSTVLVITSHPADATAGFGVPARFSVATNAGNASYQWQSSTDGGRTFADLGETPNEQGVHAATLTVAGLPDYNGRKYRVHVTTPQPGDAISNNALYSYQDSLAQGGLSQFNATLTGTTASTGFSLPGKTVDASSVTDGSVAVHAMQTGRLGLQSGVTVTGDTVTLKPATPFKAGELVEVSITSGVRGTDGYHASPIVYQFHAGSTSRYGIFPQVQTVASVPAGATALAVGDFNGDGAVDLVVGGANGATVLLNNGNFSFATGQTFGSGAVSKIVAGAFGAAGGLLDLAVVKGNGAVEIWKNAGNGTFAPSATLAGVTGTALAAADLNADGALDLFITTAGPSQVWFNNGAGTFADSGQRLGNGGAGVSVAVGDMDNDNKLDAVVANGAGNVDVWINNGSGGFSIKAVFSATNYSTEPSPADRVLLADVDHNGSMEVITMRAGKPVTFWRSTYYGYDFRSQAINGTNAGRASWTCLGDVDGDGKPDLITASSYDDSLTLRRGTATAYTEFALVPEQPGLSISGEAELADLDGDGRADLVSVSPAGVVQAAAYQVIDQTVLQNGSVNVTAAAFQKTYDGTPKYGAGRTLAAIQITAVPANGVLKQNGAAVTAGQVIPLGSLALTFVPTTNVFGFTSFTWKGSTDGTSFGAETYRDNLLVTHVPQGLNGQPDAFTLQQGGSVTGNVLTNDYNGEPLTARMFIPPAHGSVTMAADGAFTYTHDGTELPRADQFTYEVKNTATRETATVLVSLTITNRNDAPSGVTLAAAVLYEHAPAGTFAGTLTATDPDAGLDGGDVTLSLVDGASDNALFTLNGQTLRTNTVLNYADSHTRTVRVRATDSLGLSSEYDLVVGLRSVPVALAGTATVQEDGSTNVVLHGVCADERPITGFALVNSPQHGTAVLDGATVLYTPTPIFWGSDTFTFTASDGTATSAPATVSISITHVNHPPAATTQTLAATENTPLNFTATGTDVDGDPLTFFAFDLSGQGVVTGTSPNFTFTPNPDKTGAFQIFLLANDGTIDSPPVLLDGTISLVDYPPLVATVRSFLLPIDHALPLTLEALERNGKPLTYTVTVPPAHGTVVGTGPQVVYFPAGNFHGDDLFQYVASNGVYNSTPGTIQITVQRTNRPPVAHASQVVTGQRQPVEITLAADDLDEEYLGYTITRGPQHGTLTGFGATHTYTPEGLYHGEDSFEFSVTDGQYSSTAVVGITVNEVDMQPVADSKTIGAHTGFPATFTLTGSDPKGLPLTYRLVGLPAHGTLTGSLPFDVVYTSEKNYSGADALTFVVNNGKMDSEVATVAINLQKDALSPKAENDFVEEAFNNETISIDVLGNDSDYYGDPLEIVGVSAPNVGSVVISDDHKSLRYTATQTTGNGYANFGYTVGNGSTETASASVFVKVVDQHLVVTSAEDSGPGTLRDVISRIQKSSRPNAEGWTVSFSTGVTSQVLRLNTSDANDPDSALTISGNVNIAAGLSPVQVIRVDVSGTPLRAFHVLPGGTLRLNGVTLTGGQAHHGGAILNEGSLLVDGATLKANTAFAVNDEPGLGGAIYTTGTLRLVNAALTDNVADTAGGFYQLGNGAAASTVIDTATLSGHAAAGDFLSTTVNGGTASIDATALSTQTPTAPWFDALPANVTVARKFIAKVPVMVDGDAFALTATSSNPAMSGVAWTGRGTSRTLTLGGFTPAAGAQTRLTATATDGSVSYVQHTDITVDPASARPPVALADSAAIITSGSVLIPVLANDYDPDGGALMIESVSTPASGGSVAIEDGKIRFTQNGDIDGIFYDFSYVVRNAAGLTATATVSLRRVGNDYTLYLASGADIGADTLREVLDMANTYYAPGGWTIQVVSSFGNDNGGPVLVPSTVGDHGVGDSAYLVTGDVTIDASAVPGFTIRRDTAGSAMRLFRVTDTGRLTLKNAILDGGVAKHGGVLLNEGTTKLDGSTIQNGAAQVGGGVFNEGTLDTANATFTGNTASSFGGALYNRNGTAILRGSTLSGNTALDGGGVHLFGDGERSLVRLSGTSVNNPAAPHDLSASVIGSGTTVLTASADTTVNAPGDTWVNPIADRTVDDTASVPFTFTAPATATLGAESQNQAVVPASGLSVTDITAASGTLQVRARSTGFADVAVLASQGAISYGRSFRLAVNSATNSAPLAVDDSATLYQGAEAIIDVLANDSDPESAPLIVQSVGTALHGTVSTDGSSVIYTHDGSATTADAFTYVLSDGFGGMATGAVNVTLLETKLAVTSTGSGGDPGTIRQAMEFAAAHPTTGTWKIVFDASIPAGSTIRYGNYGPYYNGYTMFHVAGNVLLDGSQVPGLKIESSGGVYSPPVRFFHVQPGASLELRSLTLSKGVVQVTGSPEEGNCGGGGVVLNEGTFVARNVTFRDSIAPGNVGGAIASNGNATIIGCTFLNNRATTGTDHSARQLGTGLGGAIFQLNGTLTVTDSTFQNNSAADGASIHTAGDIDHAELNLTGSTLSGDASSHQVTLAASEGGTVTRNGSRNVLPADETAPSIGSIASVTSISGATDLPVTLGIPADAYTVSASAAPSAKIAGIQLTGDGSERVLSVTPAPGAYGPLDLKVTLVNGPLTVNETFAADIVPPTPAAPTGLVATAVSDSQLVLTWTDNATSETGYTVERSDNGADGWTTIASALAANTARYIDGGLAARTQHYYRVRCDTGGVASADSNVADGTTAATIGDGIPGWWRYRYFGDGTMVVSGAEANADPDSDGFSNLQEYLAGTDPTDARSALTVRLVRAGDNAVLVFPTVLGKVYQVETSGDLGSPGTWSVLASGIAGTGGSVTCTDASAGVQTQRFYRVSIQP